MPRSTIFMNAPNLSLMPEELLAAHAVAQPSLDLASEGVQRYAWQGAYGAMLIEVHDGIAFVNGAQVASMAEVRAAEA